MTMTNYDGILCGKVYITTEIQADIHQKNFFETKTLHRRFHTGTQVKNGGRQRIPHALWQIKTTSWCWQMT